MFLTKILQLIDKNLDNFKHWGCDFNCAKQQCYCKKIILYVDMFVINYIRKYLYKCKHISSIFTNILLKIVIKIK